MSIVTAEAMPQRTSPDRNLEKPTTDECRRTHAELRINPGKDESLAFIGSENLESKNDKSGKENFDFNKSMEQDNTEKRKLAVADDTVVSTSQSSSFEYLSADSDSRNAENGKSVERTSIGRPRLSLLSTASGDKGIFIPDTTYVIPQPIKDLIQTTGDMLREITLQNTGYQDARFPHITAEYLEQTTRDILTMIDLQQHRTFRARLRYLSEDLVISKFKVELTKRLQELTTTANESSESDDPIVNLDHILLTLKDATTRDHDDQGSKKDKKKKKSCWYRIRKFFGRFICCCQPDEEEDDFHRLDTDRFVVNIYKSSYLQRE